MKKYLLAILFVALLVSPALAQDDGDTSDVWAANTAVKIGISTIKIGTYWDMKDDQLLVGGALPIISWEDIISLDAGLATDLNKKPIPLASISVNIQELAAKVGLKYTLLDPLSIGGWYGRTADEGKIDVEHYGLYATVQYLL